MADYEHSSNYHKIVTKIMETNNLKDLDVLKKKLGELEQDDEVRELIEKCNDRTMEIWELIKEDNYQKAVSEFDIEGADIEAQINLFQKVKGYKETRKYPTCVSDGHLEYRCSVCSIMKTEKPDATGHNYLDGFCLSCGFDRNQYHVGDIGPAGGYIFYDCDADNSSGNKDGLKSSACGWRFLEAAPSDLNDGKTFVWGDNRTYGTKTGLGSGKTNTSIIVSQASNSRVPNAATVCNDFSYLGFDDWFLPSKDELVQMYENLHKSGLGGFAVSDGYYYYEYWSSSEGDYYGIDAWIQYFYDGSQYGSGRGENARVRPVRAF